jgi:hypothetical protein
VTCPACRSDVPDSAFYCVMCGASLERPAAPTAPVPVPGARLTESEARDLLAAREAVKAVRKKLGPDADPVDVLRRVRATMGTKYHHPAVCKALTEAPR